MQAAGIIKRAARSATVTTEAAGLRRAAACFHRPQCLGSGVDIRRKRTDGELFYFIRNGIRNTAMPGWQLPDQEIWQLVSFIRHLPMTAPGRGAS